MEALMTSPHTMRTSIKSWFMSLFFRSTEEWHMVDTVKVSFTGTPHAAVPARRRVTLANGVRLYHDGLGTCKAEAELPKLIWGHNGRLLGNQAELDESIARFRRVLSRQVEFKSWQWVLVDLCWQFQTRAAAVILAHEWLRFPGVRSLPSVHCGGKEISWRGGRRSLKMYDKARQFGLTTGVLRVELRLAGGQLRQQIDENAPLNFTRLWGLFRRELLALPPVELPEARRHSFADVVAALPPAARSVALLTYQQGRTVRAVSQFKRDVSNACLMRIPWNWRDQLPVEVPPLPVNVEPCRRCQNQPKHEENQNQAGQANTPRPDPKTTQVSA
jgi:hypothetical protein